MASAMWVKMRDFAPARSNVADIRDAARRRTPKYDAVAPARGLFTAVVLAAGLWTGMAGLLYWLMH